MPAIARRLPPPLPALAVPHEGCRLPVPSLGRRLEPGADLGRAWRLLAVERPALEEALDRLGHGQPAAGQGRVERHDAVPAQPEHHRRRLVTGELVPHQQHPQRRERLGQGAAQRQALLPHACHSARVAAGSLGPAPAGNAATISATVSFSQPCRTMFVQRAAGWLNAHLPRRRMEQGQDLERAPADVLMRLRRGPALRPSAAAGMGNGLKGPGLVLAPDRQPRPGIELVEARSISFFFAAASPSLTATVPPPCLPLRMTTPVEHQVRRRCQLRPAAWSVCQMV